MRLEHLFLLHRLSPGNRVLCAGATSVVLLSGCASGATATFGEGDSATTGTTLPTTTTTPTGGSSSADTTTASGTTDDVEACEPETLEDCDLEGCSAAVRLCDADGVWGDCSCACPMGGELMDGYCQSQNLECPPDAVDNGDNCIGQEVTGYECPNGGELTEDTCTPTAANPRTDIQCGEGGSSLVGVFPIDAIDHCGLNSNLIGDTFDMLPECDTIGGLTYRAWEGSNGYTVCAVIDIQMYAMMYVANRVIGGSEASYAADPLFQDIELPKVCPEGWEPLGEDSCQYEATLPE